MNTQTIHIRYSTNQLKIYMIDKVSATSKVNKVDLRSTHVMKGGVTFGICTDGVWSEEAARHRRAREELGSAQVRAYDDRA